MSSTQFCKPTQDEAQVSTYDTETFLETFADFQNQAEADAKWVPQDAPFASVDFELSKLDWIQNQDTTDNSCAVDLWKLGIFPSNDGWVLRWKWTVTAQQFISGNNEIEAFGLKATFGGVGSAPNPATNGDFIAFWWASNAANAGNGILNFSAEHDQGFFPAINRKVYVATPGSFAPVPYTKYMEIKRTSRTSAQCTIYSDPEYSIPIETVSIDITTHVEDLRYLLVTNEIVSASGTPNNSTGFMKDIQFWNIPKDLFNTPDFEENFAYNTQFDANVQWEANSAVDNDVDIVNARAFYTMLRDGTDTRLVHDMQKEGIVVSDTDWTLRWRMHMDAGNQVTTVAGANVILQLQDTDVGQTAQNDMLGLGIDNTLGVTARRWILIGKNGGATSGLQTTGNGSVPLGEQDFYLEMRRIGGTQVIAKVFADPEYKVLLHTLTITTSAANIAHRFLVLMSGDQVTSWNGIDNGFIDQVKFWNGTPAVDPDLQQPNFTDEFGGYPTQADADTNWPVVGTGINVDQPNKEIEWDFTRTGSSKSMSYDLGAGNVSDTKWTLRWKLEVQNFTQIGSSATTGWIMLSSSNAAPSSTNQDFIAVLIRNDVPGIQQEIDTQSSGGATSPDNSGLQLQFTNPWLVGTPQYYELKRLSATEYRLSVFSDAEYTQLTETDTFTIVSTVGNGLRYIKVLGFTQSAVAQTFDGIIDDIEFWNEDGTTDPAGDYQSNFARDLWKTTNASFFAVNKTLERLDFDNTAGANEAIAFDLVGRGIIPVPLVEDTPWRLRWKLNATNIVLNTNNDIALGITSLDENTSIFPGVEDGLLLQFLQQTGIDGIQVRATYKNDSGTTSTVQQTWSGLMNSGVYYCEIQRIDATNFIVALYSDAEYNNPIIIVQGTNPAGITDLRYIKTGCRAGTNGEISGNIEDVSFTQFPGNVEQKFPRLRDVVPDNDVSFVKSAHTPIAPLSEITPTLKFEQKNFFFTDFSEYITQADADADFPSTDILVARADVSVSAIDINLAGGTAEDSIVHDFGNTLDSEQWTIRFKFDILAFVASSNVGIGIDMGITSLAGLRNINQDSIGLEMTIDSDAGDQFFRGISANNAFMGNSAGVKFTNIPAVQTYYVEIKRINATNYVVSLFSDIRYRNLIEAHLETVSGGSSNIGHRFLKFAVFKPAGTNTLDVEVDDIQLWDGETDVDYQDGRLSRHLGGEILFDDFSYVDQGTADTAWPSTDVTALDPFPNVFTLIMPVGSTPTENHSERILPELVNGNFRLRAKVDIVSLVSDNATGIVGYIGLSSTNGVRLSAQDAIGILWVIDTGGSQQEIRGFSGEANWGANPGQIVLRTSVSVEVQFIEIVRTSPTSVTYNIYSDANYSVLTDTVTQTIASTITGLQYVKIVSAKPGGSNALTLTFDDIQLSLLGAQDYAIFEDTNENHIRVFPPREVVVHSGSIDVESLLGVTPPNDVNANDWGVRFKLKVNSITQADANTNNYWIGLGDLDNQSGNAVAQDFIGLGILIDNGSKFYGINSTDNANLLAGDNVADRFVKVPLATDELYVEIIRFDQTNVEITLYADAEFSQIIERVVKTDVAITIGGFKNFKIVSRNGAPVSTNAMDFELSLIRIFDGLPSKINTGLLTDKLGLFTNDGGLA